MTARDKVTAIGGKAIPYDAIGNPLSYDGWTFTWKAGRMLDSLVKTGTNAQFSYDHNGLRMKKVVNGVTTHYTLSGRNIVHMTQGSSDLHFFYDAQGRPAMVRFGGTDYFYVYDLQGDVVAMVDTDGTQVVEYMYDAWGAPISKTGSLASTLGSLNPFRYRGYVYDEETGLYYLRTRYYNPLWKRFLNADQCMTGGILSTNLFAYCKNIPAMGKDSNGNLGVFGFISAITLGASLPYIKEIVSATADSFLSERNWTLTNILFQHSLWGNGSAINDSTEGVGKVKQLIANDPQTLEMIQPILDSMTPGSAISYASEKGYEFTSGDMYYALQHVNYDVNIVMDKDKNWKAAIHITDNYDFDAIRWGFSLGNIANNGGLFLQTIGIMKEYSIDVTVEMSSDQV